jgi:hypothetical protein
MLIVKLYWIVTAAFVQLSQPALSTIIYSSIDNDDYKCDFTNNTIAENIRLVRSPFSCRVFHICAFYKQYTLTCADGLYFDENLNSCNFEYMVDCPLGVAIEKTTTTKTTVTFTTHFEKATTSTNLATQETLNSINSSSERFRTDGVFVNKDTIVALTSLPIGILNATYSTFNSATPSSETVTFGSPLSQSTTANLITSTTAPLRVSPMQPISSPLVAAASLSQPLVSIQSLPIFYNTAQSVTNALTGSPSTSLPIQVSSTVASLSSNSIHLNTFNISNEQQQQQPQQHLQHQQEQQLQQSDSSRSKLASIQAFSYPSTKAMYLPMSYASILLTNENKQYQQSSSIASELLSTPSSSTTSSSSTANYFLVSNASTTSPFLSEMNSPYTFLLFTYSNQKDVSPYETTPATISSSTKQLERPIVFKDDEKSKFNLATKASLAPLLTPLPLAASELTNADQQDIASSLFWSKFLQTTIIPNLKSEQLNQSENTSKNNFSPFF